MAKFATATPNVTSVLMTTDKRTATYEGGEGYERDAKSALFLLAVSNLVSEQTFYESATDRDERFRSLIQQVAKEDPEWIAGFVPYLRNAMQMRSASVVMAAEYVKSGAPHGRSVVSSALQRADEPAELLGYWSSTYGKHFPQPLKRGIADACQRLYTERAALKYNSSKHTWRMADVLDLCHVKPRSSVQSALFKYIIDARHNREDVPSAELTMIAAAHALDQVPVEDRRAYLSDMKLLEVAGMTWEKLSGWLQGPMDAEAWQAVIPQMGYMAQLRNLRNFEQAGVSDEVLNGVAARLADPLEVERSRQFPIRFYSAFKNLASERFSYVLEQALDASVVTIPHLSGKTLVLVDVSGSMQSAMSARSTVQRSEVAAIFGAALAKRCQQAELFAYSDAVQRISQNGSVLRIMGDMWNWKDAGHGTATHQAIAATYRDHDRIVLLTDEQSHPAYTYSYSLLGVSASPAFNIEHLPCPIYTFNLAGYAPSGMEQGKNGRYVFGGLTDAGFSMIEALESQKDGRWPWESVPA